jgi:hypothetical protein
MLIGRNIKMSKVWNPHAIDYSAGVDVGEDGQIIPKKVGCFVQSYEYAVEFARKWKA